MAFSGKRSRSTTAQSDQQPQQQPSAFLEVDDLEDASPTIAPLQRNYTEPIGPASATVASTAFLREVGPAWARATEALNTFNTVLGVSGIQNEVLARCSVQDLEDASSSLHANRHVRVELIKYHEKRLFPAGHGVDEDDEMARVDGNDGEEEEPDVPSQGSRVVDPEVIALLAEGEKSELGILKPLRDIPFYLRKTRFTDYNSLGALRPSLTTPPPVSLAELHLSSLIYVVTFHPIARVVNRTPFASRAQTLYCLGSTTLWEIRQNLSVGGEAIPAETADDPNDANQWIRGRKRPRWSNERRDVGSVFGIEGVLHADAEPGKRNYADMVVSLINHTPWSYKRFRFESPDGEASPAPVSDKPEWKAGSSMQSTAIGTLSLRIGEPYWFLHQGNCEHVFTVDFVRHTHPSDPLDGYPHTSFLSRGGQVEKCRVCDRDPGTIITLDDELAGLSPALLCETCFKMLHGTNEDGHVVVVPVVPDS